MCVNTSAAVLAQGAAGSSMLFEEILLACCCVVLIAFIAIAVKGRNGNLKHFKVARVRRGIPILGALVILTLVRIMVNH